MHESNIPDLCCDGSPVNMVGLGTYRSYLLAGLNVVLISRTQQKLEEAATDISKKYKVETKVVSADLSQPGDEKWSKIGAVISQLDVGLLVNNAGRSYDHAEYLDAADEDMLDSIVEINIQVSF